MPKEPAADDFPYDFFVSRRGYASAVAKEVSDVLTDAGYSVIVQDYDIPHSANFVAAIHDSVKRARHLIALLTEDYDQSPFTEAEWTSFFALSKHSGGKRRLVVLRVADVEAPGLLAPIVYGNLFGITSSEKRREIILAAAEGRSIGTRRGTHIFRGVPPRNPDFTGRDILLDSLHRTLNDNDRPTAVTQATIHGLGGVGKSTLAAEYAYRHKDDYVGVWWAPAENRTVLATSLAEFGREIDTKIGSEKNVEKAAGAALAKLGEYQRPWLLIYDNVSSPDDLRGIIPNIGARLLITSRWQDWQGLASALEVDVMEPEAAVEFLMKRANRYDPASAAPLAASLGYLPLALDHAGAYVKRSGISFDEYTKRWRELLLSAPKGTAYPASVGATFGLAIEKIRTEIPAAEAIFSLIAVLAPERIPIDLIYHAQSELAQKFGWLHKLSGRNDPSFFASPSEIDQALMSVAEVSLLKHDRFADGTVAVLVHRLVQATMRDRLAKKRDLGLLIGSKILPIALPLISGILRVFGKRPARIQLGKTDRFSLSLALAIQWLASAFPINARLNANSWPRCERLLPHVLHLREEAKKAHIEIFELSILLVLAGDYFSGRAAYDQAEQFYRDGITIGKNTRGANDVLLAKHLIHFGILLATCKHYDEAEATYREAIAIQEKAVRAGFRRSSQSTGNLANVLRDTGRPIEAEQLYHDAINIEVKISGREHPETAALLYNLALLHIHAERYKEAESLLREVSAIGRKMLDSKHRFLGVWLGGLASLLIITGRFSEAEPLLREVLTITESAVGRGHPDFMHALTQLMRVLRKTGRNREANRLLKRYRSEAAT